MEQKIFTRKLISYFLSFLILFSSCSVYQKKGISMEEASRLQKRVKATRTDDKIIKLKKIIKIDSVYYGIIDVKNNAVQVPLKVKEFKKIQPLDATTSTVLTVLAIAIPIGVLILVVQADAVSSGWSDPQ
jgi:hypothetical protein